MSTSGSQTDSSSPPKDLSVPLTATQQMIDKNLALVEIVFMTQVVLHTLKIALTLFSKSSLLSFARDCSSRIFQKATEILYSNRSFAGILLRGTAFREL